MSIGSDWFSGTNAYSVFQSTLERSQLIVKMAQAKRMESDIAALSTKYDGKKAAGIEDQINKIADQKFDVSNYLSNVQLGQKRIDDLRTQLLSAKDAIAKGSGAAFDLSVNTINTWIGRQSADPDSLIANNGSGSGSWAKSVTVVNAAGMSVDLTHQFMGSDYVIALDDGQMLRPDKLGAKLTGIGNGGVPFADLTMDRTAQLTDSTGTVVEGSFKVAAPVDGVPTQGTLTMSGGATIQGTLVTAGGKTTLTDVDGNSYALTYSDQISVTANTTDADGNVTATTYHGTLKKGGLGLTHSWSYGNFNDADPEAKATARQAASADIDSAMKKLAQIERNLNIYQAGLSGMSKKLDSQSATLAVDYKKESEEELSAKQAERRAIETRFKIATNAMALANETTSTFVYQMFIKSSGVEKKSMTDIMLDMAGV